MNPSFPGQTYASTSFPPRLPMSFPPGGVPQGIPQLGPGGLPMMMPPDLATLAQQGYMQQQQQLAAMQAALGRPPMMPGQGMGGGPPGPKSNKKKSQNRPAPPQQVLARQQQQLGPPQTTEHYIKNAMLPRGAEAVEPWADALDEMDPREMAMGRFRARQEIMAEIFGPERLKDIPISTRDPWAGLGMDGETLEEKVEKLEEENEQLEGSLEVAVDEWRTRLRAIEETGELPAVDGSA